MINKKIIYITTILIIFLTIGLVEASSDYCNSSVACKDAQKYFLGMTSTFHNEILENDRDKIEDRGRIGTYINSAEKDPFSKCWNFEIESSSSIMSSFILPEDYGSFFDKYNELLLVYEEECAGSEYFDEEKFYSDLSALEEIRSPLCNSWFRNEEERKDFVSDLMHEFEFYYTNHDLSTNKTKKYFFPSKINQCLQIEFQESGESINFDYSVARRTIHKIGADILMDLALFKEDCMGFCEHEYSRLSIFAENHFKTGSFDVSELEQYSIYATDEYYDFFNKCKTYPSDDYGVLEEEVIFESLFEAEDIVSFINLLDLYSASCATYREPNEYLNRPGNKEFAERFINYENNLIVQANKILIDNGLYDDFITSFLNNHPRLSSFIFSGDRYFKEREIKEQRNKYYLNNIKLLFHSFFQSGDCNSYTRLYNSFFYRERYFDYSKYYDAETIQTLSEYYSICENEMSGNNRYRTSGVFDRTFQRELPKILEQLNNTDALSGYEETEKIRVVFTNADDLTKKEFFEKYEVFSDFLIEKTPEFEVFSEFLTDESRVEFSAVYLEENDALVCPGPDRSDRFGGMCVCHYDESSIKNNTRIDRESLEKFFKRNSVEGDIFVILTSQDCVSYANPFHHTVISWTDKPAIYLEDHDIGKYLPADEVTPYTLIHELGHAIFGLTDEYENELVRMRLESQPDLFANQIADLKIRAGITRERTLRHGSFPNCAPFDQAIVSSWWGDIMGPVDDIDLSSLSELEQKYYNKYVGEVDAYISCFRGFYKAVNNSILNDHNKFIVKEDGEIFHLPFFFGVVNDRYMRTFLNHVTGDVRT